MRKSYGLIVCLMLLQLSPAKAEDLLNIYQQALQFDPELQMAGYKVEIGSDQKGVALGAMLPQINASTNWSQNNQMYGRTPATKVGADLSKHYNGTRYNVSLNQSLLDFSKFWEWRRAQQAKDQYALEQVAILHELMFKVVERYFNILFAEDDLFYLKAETETMQKELQQAQKLFAKQVILITDVYEIEARLDQVKATVIEAETAVVVAKQSLRELTNSEPGRLYKLRKEINFIKLEGKLEDWIAVSRSENPTLAAQIKAIEAATANVGVYKSRHLPVVDLQLSYISTNQGYQSQAALSQYDVTVGAINVNIPLFSGGVMTSQMNKAQHELSSTQTENEAKIRFLIKETTDSFMTTNNSVDRIAATRRALDSAVKSREALEKAFEYGEESMADVLYGLQLEYRVLRELAQVRYEYIKQKIRFMKATGLITDENMIEVNGWLQALPS
jgi:outer membrane protein